MKTVAAVAAALVWASATAAAVPLQVTEVATGVFVHQGRQEDFSAENAGGIANLGFVDRRAQRGRDRQRRQPRRG